MTQNNAVAGAHTATEPHAASSASKLNWLRAGVLGANDGIVSTACILLGVIAAGSGTEAIMVAAVAGAVAGAVSMALGEYVSVSAQRDSERHFVNLETTELRDYPEEEHEELVGILQGYGVSREVADQAVKDIEAGDPLKAHLQLELGMDGEELTNPWAAAISSAISFSLGALLPIISVLVAPEASRGLAVTIVTLLTLALTGLISAWISGTNKLRAIVRLLIGGALGLAVTYGIGLLFDTGVA